MGRAVTEADDNGKKFHVLCGVPRAQQRGLKFSVVWTVKYYIQIFIILINQRISAALHLKVAQISSSLCATHTYTHTVCVIS